MATKRELEARIASLEAQVAHLLAERVAQPVVPVFVHGVPPFTYPYTTWSSEANNTTLRAVSSS